MFIHWGLYAIPAGEWKGQQVPGIGEWIMNRAKIPVRDYEQLAKQFNPVKFDPDAWVRIAKTAGQKYMVITAKHHDGFALWDSRLTGWDVGRQADLLAPLAKECRRRHIRLFLYYSLLDRHEPTYALDKHILFSGAIPADVMAEGLRAAHKALRAA